MEGGNPAKDSINFTTYNNRLWFTSHGRPWYVDGATLQLADSYNPQTTNYSLQLFAESDTEPAYFVQPYKIGQPYNILLNKRLVKVNPDASMEVIDTTLKAQTDILAYKNQNLIYSEKNTDVSPYIADIKSLNANTGAVSLLTSFSAENTINFETGWTKGNDKVFLSVNNGGVTELWVTDGSTSGTSKIDLAQGSSKETAYFMPDPENGGYFGASGNIFFRASINNSDYHLWISDGTASGTERIEVDGQPLKFVSGNIDICHYAKGIVFFADHPNYGTELFYSDGTNAGTKLLADLIPGTSSGFSYMLGIISDTLYLSANLSADYGAELYAVPLNLCADACPPGYICVNGECVQSDPCANVICSEGELCYQGGCFPSCIGDDCVDLGPNLSAG